MDKVTEKDKTAAQNKVTAGILLRNLLTSTTRFCSEKFGRERTNFRPATAASLRSPRY